MIWNFTGRRPLPVRDYVDHIVCGFNRGWSYVVKSRVQSLATPCVTE